MLHSLKLYDEITKIRRLITKPTLKSPSEARAAFLEFLQDHHKVTTLESPLGQALLLVYKESTPMKSLLDYMEIPA